MMTTSYQGLSRAIIFISLLPTGSVVAFTHPPPTPFRPAAVRGCVTGIEMKLSSSDGSGNESNIKSSKGQRQPKAFGWTKPADARRGPGAGSAAQQGKVDWSKLFATPEPEPVPRSRPLIALSRSFAGVAQGSFYAWPLFLFFFGLMCTFSPALGAQTVSAWALGRVAFGLSMRDEDVSRRMPVGFVGYASLFLILGGLAFRNGLTAVSRLGLIL